MIDAAFRLTDQAEADLNGIWYFIAQDNIEAANNIIDTLLERRFPALAAWLMMGRPRPDLGSNLRSFPVRNYLIVYRPADFGVIILHVRDSRRQEPEPGDILDA